MNRETALVVFSGGQDSTTCLFWAKRNFKKVYALSFLYGQKHQKEVELAREIARKAPVETTLTEAPAMISDSKPSSRETTAVPITESALPSTHAPPAGTSAATSRNLMFFNLHEPAEKDPALRFVASTMVVAADSPVIMMYPVVLAKSAMPK